MMSTCTILSYLFVHFSYLFIDLSIINSTYAGIVLPLVMSHIQMFKQHINLEIRHNIRQIDIIFWEVDVKIVQDLWHSHLTLTSQRIIMTSLIALEHNILLQLFVCSSLSRIIHWYGDDTITGDGFDLCSALIDIEHAVGIP